MRYYVVSDVHGFYDEMIKALTDASFFTDTSPHKLIVCGDMMDRGKQAVKMQEFMMNLLLEDKLIFVRGNHEDLMLCMLDDIIDDFQPFLDFRSYHIRNGTLDTAAQLNRFTYAEFLTKPMDFIFKTKQMDFVRRLIPASVNYFETQNYIFVHGWIPCKIQKEYYWGGCRDTYAPISDWRNATTAQWNEARWINGMEAAEFGKIIEPGKTIVCGHWHASYGHSVVKRDGKEFGPTAKFEPYCGNGVIGIDACTAYTRKVNCLVIDDEDL